ncbi:MAG TPA: arylesterase [Alphaproteobacteria bacterium]|nr:arylesterase [Alphaproteobacteria bacterium]
MDAAWAGGNGIQRRRVLRRRLSRALLPYVLAAALFNVPLLCGGAALAAAQRVLLLGDSISAGYGLPADEALPAQLQAALRKAGYHVDVINGGVSGDTTAGGLARLDWMLAEKPDIVVVELGGNDGLRGLDPKETYTNLDRILDRLAQAKVRVLLAGMLAPPNLGADYGRDFDGIYPALAKRHHCLLVPFILDGVAAKAALNQADGIHPNAKGVQAIVRLMLPYMEKLLAAGTG